MKWGGKKTLHLKQLSKTNMKSFCSGGRIKWIELYSNDASTYLNGSLRKQDVARNKVKLVMWKPRVLCTTCLLIPPTAFMDISDLHSIWI